MDTRNTFSLTFLRLRYYLSLLKRMLVAQKPDLGPKIKSEQVRKVAKSWDTLVLGILYSKQSKSDEAEEIYQRVLQKYAKEQGSEQMKNHLPARALSGLAESLGPLSERC